MFSVSLLFYNIGMLVPCKGLHNSSVEYCPPSPPLTYAYTFIGYASGFYWYTLPVLRLTRSQHGHVKSEYTLLANIFIMLYTGCSVFLIRFLSFLKNRINQKIQNKYNKNQQPYQYYK